MGRGAEPPAGRLQAVQGVEGAKPPGGKPDFAQGGGADGNKVQACLDAAKARVMQQLVPA